MSLAAMAFGQARWVTSKPVVNMYSKPSLDADVVSQAIYGVTVQQVASTDKSSVIPEGWIQIKTPDDYTGWVLRESFLPLDEKENYAGKDKRVVTVANRGANVYREPDVTEHAPVLVLPFEAALEVIGVSEKQSDRWLKVRLTNGSEAWVQRGDVQDRTGKLLSIPESIELAKKFLGVTYTWGGTSSFGFDCSGFTQMLMRQRGVVMPRDADVQARWDGFVTVKKEDLKAGDLLFFGTEKSITHTGMYIGNGEFIHDTTHDHPMVQISRLGDPYWTKLLVIAKRTK
ncbi:MAG TPA: SH3 domain-containing C40 family peptidase [Terriglobales bacterium]|nr:SH3 domain-containing C40 family peptidase [Terriglobales bacterium]